MKQTRNLRDNKRKCKNEKAFLPNICLSDNIWLRDGMEKENLDKEFIKCNMVKLPYELQVELGQKLAIVAPMEVPNISV